MKIFKDVDTEQFWLTIWSMASVVFLVLITIVSYNTYHEDNLLSDLIKEGHDPMELACLFEAGDSMKTPCLLLAQAKAKLLLEKNNVSE